MHHQTETKIMLQPEKRESKEKVLEKIFTAIKEIQDQVGLRTGEKQSITPIDINKLIEPQKIETNFANLPGLIILQLQQEQRQSIDPSKTLGTSLTYIAKFSDFFEQVYCIRGDGQIHRGICILNINENQKCILVPQYHNKNRKAVTGFQFSIVTKKDFETVNHIPDSQFVLFKKIIHAIYTHFPQATAHIIRLQYLKRIEKCNLEQSYHLVLHTMQAELHRCHDISQKILQCCNKIGIINPKFATQHYIKLIERVFELFQKATNTETTLEGLLKHEEAEFRSKVTQFQELDKTHRFSDIILKIREQQPAKNDQLDQIIYDLCFKGLDTTAALQSILS